MKRNKDNILLESTAQQIESKSFKDFWSSIKKIKGNNKLVTNVIDDKYTDSDIADHFSCKYNNLFNSVPDNDLNDIEIKIDNLINKNCCKNKCKAMHCHTISEDNIRKAISCLQNGKDEENYNVFSDHFIYASDLFFNKLSLVIGAMLKHGTTTNFINKSTIKPIPKNLQKSLSDSMNYRAISKNSIISKIIDYVIIDIIHENMETSDFQFAYKKGFSTSMCSFLVAETIQYYRLRGSNVYMVSLDATKAFDRVQYSKLFNILIEKEICPLVIRLILNVYLTSSAVVKWRNSISKSFSISNGVKQGAVISAPLFALYIDPLINELKNSKLGCHFGGINANAFAYADDVVLLAPSCSGIRGLISICEIYAKEYFLSFNPNKCSILIFADSDFYFNNINIKLCGQTIRNVKCEKHLGHVFEATHNIINIDSVIKDVKVRTNVILNNFRQISWQAKTKLFLSQCSSLYGCQLWNLEDPNIEKLYTAWRVCSRRIIGLRQDARSYMLHHLMNSMSINNIIKKRILCFYISGFNHNVQMISKFFKNILVSNSSRMLTNINIILNTLGIRYRQVCELDKVQIHNICKENDGVPDSRCETVKELLTTRELQQFNFLETRQVTEILNYVSTLR